MSTSLPRCEASTAGEEEEFAVGTASRERLTYGGFPTLTWQAYRRDLANFTPKCRYARDLPHSFQDHINNMSPHDRMMPAMRTVFEGMISQSAVLANDPGSPPIYLENDVDDEPTPLWEFHYTNEMWHGEGVPPPDIRNLINCDCRGGCSPRSKTCACLLRQRKLAEDSVAGFAYDKAGKLKNSQYPVFECNDLCGCGAECQNRVVQQGRKVQVLIKKTRQKGWGVFAGRKKIPSGTFIGICSGELLAEEEAQIREVQYRKSRRLNLFDLDFYHQKAGNPDWKVQFTIDVLNAGNFTRFLNHSCEPNAVLQACYINESNVQKPLLTVFSCRNIEAGEEICISYSGHCDNESDMQENDVGKESNPLQRDEAYSACLCGSRKCQGFIVGPSHS